MTGPLAGVTIIEVAGIGPGPFAAMMLSDMGARVVRIDRAARVITPADVTPSPDVLNRGRQSVAVDLKRPEGAEIVLRLVETADGLIEGFRPGVAERLGIGPEQAMARNPRLIYGRMTGWGQTGPRAPEAGHDIDYIAISGVLGAMGPADGPPQPPLNLVADFGGGGMLMAFGIVCALLEARESGQGQVIDAAMVDGSAILATMMYALRHQGLWGQARGDNLLDGSAPFYRTYETKDGCFMAVGALEPQFFEQLLTGLGISEEAAGPQFDRAGWRAMQEVFADRFRSRTQAEWTAVFSGSDACVVPVVESFAAIDDPHVAARQTIVHAHGFDQPAPAPRFSRTPGGIAGPAHHPGSHTDAVLSQFGWTSAELAGLRADGVIA